MELSNESITTSTRSKRLAASGSSGSVQPPSSSIREVSPPTQMVIVDVGAGTTQGTPGLHSSFDGRSRKRSLLMTFHRSAMRELSSPKYTDVSPATVFRVYIPGADEKNCAPSSSHSNPKSDGDISLISSAPLPQEFSAVREAIASRIEQNLGVKKEEALRSASFSTGVSKCITRSSLRRFSPCRQHPPLSSRQGRGGCGGSSSPPHRPSPSPSTRC